MSAYRPGAPARYWRGTFTPAVAAVTELVAQGFTGPEIAARLFVAPSTVKFHKAEAFRQTGTHNAVQLARWWWTHVEQRMARHEAG